MTGDLIIGFGDSFLPDAGGEFVSVPATLKRAHKSEVKRRKAGRMLLMRLKEIEKACQDYHLIAHSHGGFVIYHALLRACAQAEVLTHLPSWLTIGTAFILTKPRLLLYSRLNDLGKVAFALAVTTLLVFLYIPALYYLDGAKLIICPRCPSTRHSHLGYRNGVEKHMAKTFSNCGACFHFRGAVTETWRLPQLAGLSCPGCEQFRTPRPLLRCRSL
jgi:hypothetical protein